ALMTMVMTSLGFSSLMAFSCSLFRPNRQQALAKSSRAASRTTERLLKLSVCTSLKSVAIVLSPRSAWRRVCAEGYGAAGAGSALTVRCRIAHSLLKKLGECQMICLQNDQKLIS